jgi:hypothetical protein
MHATKLTQAQAARAAGVTRTSIWRAVRRGRLSAERMNDGSVRIDASELLRVYPQADLARVANGSDNRTGARSRDERTVAGDAAHGELDALRAFIDELKRDKERLQRELEAAADERVRLLTMLEEERHEVKLLTAARTPKKSWWQKLW